MTAAVNQVQAMDDENDHCVCVCVCVCLLEYFPIIEIDFGAKSRPLSLDTIILIPSAVVVSQKTKEKAVRDDCGMKVADVGGAGLSRVPNRKLGTLRFNLSSSTLDSFVCWLVGWFFFFCFLLVCFKFPFVFAE